MSLSLSSPWPNARTHCSRRAILNLIARAGLLLVLVTSLVHEVDAGDADRDHSPVIYHREYVLESRIDEYLAGQGAYREIDVDQFERLIKAVTIRASRLPSIGATRIEQAKFEARLADSLTLTGTATLDVAHESTVTTLLPWGDCSLAIENAHWGSQEETPAQIGLSPSGRQVLLVPKAGPLNFGWSVAGQLESARVARFELRLPRATIGRMSLDLPDDCLPWLDGGTAREDSGQPGESTDSSSPNGTRRWHLQLEGRGLVTLRILFGNSKQGSLPAGSYERRIDYDVSSGGVVAQETLQFDSSVRPLTELVADLHSSTRVVSARLGDREIPWVTRRVEGSGSHEVTFSFPKVLNGSSHVLSVETAMAVAEDKAWALPKLRPRSLSWRKGRISLMVRRPLSLVRLELDEAEQSEVAEVLGAPGGERFIFDEHSADAQVLVRVQGRAVVPEVSSFLDVTLNEREMTGKALATVRTSEGKVFTIEAAIANHWQIDSVESNRAEDEFEWELQRTEAGDQRMLIQLSQGVSATRPLQLTFVGRWRRSPLGEAIKMEDLRWIAFPAARKQQRIVHVAASDPLELDVAGADELRQIDPDEVDQVHGEDVAGIRGGLYFADDEGAQALQVRLRQQTPRIATENYVSVRFEEDRQEESYRIVCSPESTAIERLNVHFSQSREEPLSWTMGEGATDPIVARKWSTAETAASEFGQEGETWELELPRPMTERFEIHARRSTAIEGSLPISLIFVLQASDQLGGVTIHAGTGTAVTVNNRGLNPIPANTVDVEDSSTIRAAYRYEPIRHAQFGGDPLLEVAVKKDASLVRLALAWRAHVTSRYELDGQTAHEAVFHIENQGQARVALQLPVGCEVRTVYVDEVPQPVTRAGKLHVDLPLGKRYPIVRVRYDARSKPLRRLGRIHPPRPQIDIPVLCWQATVLTPPDYQIIWARGAADPQQSTVGLPERVLGPLAAFNSSVGSPSEPQETEPAPPTTASGSLESDSLKRSHANLLTASHGWNIYHGVFDASVDSSYLVLHDGMLTTLAWTSFLVVAAGLTWLSPRRLRVWGIVFLLLGLLAILSPSVVARIAAGAFSGAILAALLRLMRVRGLADPAHVVTRELGFSASPPEGSTVLHASRIVLYCVTGAVALIAANSIAADHLGQQLAHRVVIPIDQDRNQVGDSYFIPQVLYDELIRSSVVKQSPDEAWIITGGVYRGVVVPSAADAAQQLTDFTATFDLQTFSDGAVVEIPLSREEVAYQGNATLDGRLARAGWSENGSRLSVEIRRRGRYRLVVPLEPKGKLLDGQFDCQMSIPPLPTTRIELENAASAAGLTINGVRHSGRDLATDEPVTGRLGATDQLRLSWRSRKRNEREVRVDQYVWLRVRPRSAIVEARWKTRSGEVLPRRLRIQADRSLRLVTRDSDDFTVVRQQDDSKDSRVYVIDTFASERPVRALSLTFVLRNEQGIGRLLVPEIALLDMPFGRRYAGLSVAPSLEFEIENQDRLRSVSEEFIARSWGEGPVPAQAFELTDDSHSWGIVSRSVTAETAYESELAIGFEGRLARVQFDAQLNTAKGHVYQHQLRVPREFVATTVSLSAQGVDRLYRWSQTDDGRLTLFFARPVSGLQRLSVAGNWDLAEADSPLPTFALLGGLRKSRRLALFRRDEVVVEIGSTKGIQKIEGPAASLLSLVEPELLAFGREIGIYDLDATASATLRVTENHPVVRGRQTTELAQNQGDWDMTVDYEVKVESGVVGTLRFEIPPSVADPIRISPSVPHRLVKLPNTQVRQLVVYPHDAVTDSYSLQIHAPLEFAAGDRVRVPDVRIAGNHAELERFIIMPRQVEGQRISWEVLDLQPRTRTATKLHVRVMKETFSAALAAVAPRRGDPQVRLASIQTTLVGDNRLYSVASFDLEPAGRTRCRLVMPEGAEILGVRVAGLPVVLSGNERRPVINLGSDQLPHRVEVVYQGSVGQPEELLDLAVPGLYDLGTDSSPVEEEDERRIEIERSFWTIETTGAFEESFELVAPEVRNVTTAIDRDMERLGILSDLVADVTSEQPDEVLAHWYRRWARRIAQLRQRVESRLEYLQMNDKREEIRERIRDVEQQQESFEERFSGILERSHSEEAEDHNTSYPPGSPLSTQPFNSGMVLSMRGAPSQISLGRVDESDGQLSLQFTTAIVYVLGLCGVLMASRRGWLADIAWQWPHLLGVLAGIAIFLLWSPGFLGIAIVLLSLWLALQYPLSRQHVVRR